MNKILNNILPKTVNNDYKGSKISLWIFVILAIASTVRSSIHFFAPDGGSGSIAGLDLSKGGENIIFAFGLWGLSQLLYAFIQILVAFKYRALIPLFYLLLLLETLGRMAVGAMKPPVLLHGAPLGGIANYVLLPISIIMFFLSLNNNRHEKKND
ncbi:hypothetical protein F8154_04815 [Alkaliphilus pronyensis]|uniref:DUF4345 domain-containing protein n=1 Tax=Alkaliphilus pronyensis TaxID=1482732 RepID=A0A6I0FBB1_9FIRM|nr:hypothetical protein [Alkaliphilus pronyensis]KAB3536084.1 hypothetical protein F8154_04815 [Alkaliphilus pronyensis]